MRKVYKPEQSSTGLAMAVIVSAGLTAVMFGILPFVHQVAKPERQLELRKASAADLPPPVEEVTPPPPPPAPERNDTPPPSLAEAAPPQQLTLSALDLDIGTGTGGALGAAIGAVQSVKEAVATDLAVFNVTDLDKQPVLLAPVSPAYPLELRKSRVEGSVVILFVLDEDGRVDDPRIESSSRPEFERPALDAVRKWKFKPGEKEGAPVKTYMRLPMRFKIAS